MYQSPLDEKWMASAVMTDDWETLLISINDSCDPVNRSVPLCSVSFHAYCDLIFSVSIFYVVCFVSSYFVPFHHISLRFTIFVTFHFALISCYTSNGLRLFYRDLTRFDGQDVSTMGHVVNLVDNFDCLYDYITNDGRTFFFRTNMDAPKYKV